MNAKIVEPIEVNFSDDELTFLPFFLYSFMLKKLPSYVVSLIRYHSLFLTVRQTTATGKRKCMPGSTATGNSSAQKRRVCGI